MFLFAAMACVALASCTKNEQVNVPQEDVVTFAAPVTALNTKAVEIQGTYPTTENFSVFAHYYTDLQAGYSTLADGTLYMNNVETQYDLTLNGWDSKAVTGGVSYYWPKQGTLTFAAYSPTSANGDMTSLEYAARGFQFTEFVVNDDPADQYDLLFSERAYNQTKSSMNQDAPYYGVQLNFNHALSSVLFTVKTGKDYEADNFQIWVNKVELQNVKNKGNFDQGLVDAPNRVTRLNTEWPGWTPDETSTQNYVAYESLTGQKLTTTATNLETVTSANNTNFILLPQYLTTDVTLYVEYTIKNNNTSAVVSQTASVSLREYGAVTQWYRGNRYTYNVTVDLDKIYFDPVVTEWANVDAGSVTIGK